MLFMILKITDHCISCAGTFLCSGHTPGDTSVEEMAVAIAGTGLHSQEFRKYESKVSNTGASNYLA